MTPAGGRSLYDKFGVNLRPEFTESILVFVENGGVVLRVNIDCLKIARHLPQYECMTTVIRKLSGIWEPSLIFSPSDCEPLVCTYGDNRQACGEKLCGVGKGRVGIFMYISHQIVLV